MGKSRTILSVAILSALSGMLFAGEHIKVTATWENASAEEIQHGLLPVSNLAVMTVVDDGKATLYFTGKAPEINEIIKKASGNLPKDLVFVSVNTEEGELPAAPVPSSQKQVTFHISADKSARFGISTSDLSAQLAKLKAAQPGDLNSAYDTAVFTLPDGKKVPIRDLAEIRMTEVKRPLVTKQP